MSFDKTGYKLTFISMTDSDLQQYDTIPGNRFVQHEFYFIF